MTIREKALSIQMRQLLSALAKQGTLHLAEVETDLTQTNFLLGEAIAKLGASFMAIHQAVCAQQAIVDQLLAQSQGDTETVQKLEDVKSQISQHINSAVTGLQFQDMTSQLIERTIRRVNGLRDVFVAVSESGSVESAGDGLDEMNVLLSKISKTLEDQSIKLESVLCKPVSQTHMESGDIELF
jgi:Sec7-like guanine-nucleotide exchange factor